MSKALRVHGDPVTRRCGPWGQGGGGERNGVGGQGVASANKDNRKAGEDRNVFSAMRETAVGGGGGVHGCGALGGCRSAFVVLGGGVRIVVQNAYSTKHTHMHACLHVCAHTLTHTQNTHAHVSECYRGLRYAAMEEKHSRRELKKQDSSTRFPTQNPSSSHIWKTRIGAPRKFSKFCCWGRAQGPCERQVCICNR